MNTFSFDGLAIEALGVTARSASDWLTGPTVERGGTPLLGRHGIVPSTARRGAVRRMVLGLTVPVPSLAARATTLRAVRDAIIGGARRVRSADAPGRFIVCDVRGWEVEPIAQRSFTEQTRAAVVNVALYDHFGVSFADEPRVLVLSTTPTALRLGTAVSTGIVYLSGTWAEGASRTLTYRSNAGITYGEMTLTAPTGSGGLGTNDVLEIDLHRQYITKVASSGARTDAAAWRASGAWFGFDPADGDALADRWPTLALSTGAGVVIYREAFEE